METGEGIFTVISEIFLIMHISAAERFGEAEGNNFQCHIILEGDSTPDLTLNYL